MNGARWSIVGITLMLQAAVILLTAAIRGHVTAVSFSWSFGGAFAGEVTFCIAAETGALDWLYVWADRALTRRIVAWTTLIGAAASYVGSLALVVRDHGQGPAIALAIAGVLLSVGYLAMQPWKGGKR